MTSPLPNLQYLIAFNNGGQWDPTSASGIAPAGTTGAAGYWTDITQWVLGHSITRGRQHEMTAFEAGTLTLQLDNTDGRFNPYPGSSSPYLTSGQIPPRLPIQVRAQDQGGTWHYRFTGYVNTWTVQWPDPLSSQVEVTAADALRTLGATMITPPNDTSYAATVLSDSPLAFFRMNDAVGATGAMELVSGVRGLTMVYTYAFGAARPFVTDPGTSVSLGSSNAPGLGGPGYGDGGPYATDQLADSTSWVYECWFNSTFGQNITAANAGGIEVYGQNNGPPAYNDGLNIQVTSYDLSVHCYNSSSTLTGLATYTFSSSSAPYPLDGLWHHLVCSIVKPSTVFFVLDGVTMTPTVSVSGFTLGHAGSQRFGSGLDLNAPKQGPILLANAAIYHTLSAARALVHYNVGTAGEAAVKSGYRIAAVLGIIGWPTTGRSINQGHFTIQANHQDLTTVSALSHIQQCEMTEQGAFFVAADGTITFKGNDALSPTTNPGTVYTSSQATIGDQVGDIPFQPGITLAIDDQDTWTEAQVTRQDGVLQSAANDAATALYGRSTWTPSGTPLYTNDADSLALAQQIVSRYHTPHPRVSAVSVQMTEVLGSSSMVATLLALELTYGLTFRRLAAGYTTLLSIEGISEAVTADSWLITFALAPMMSPGFADSASTTMVPGSAGNAGNAVGYGAVGLRASPQHLAQLAIADNPGIFQVSASVPPNPSQYSMYYDTTKQQLGVADATHWHYFAPVATSGSGS